MSNEISDHQCRQDRRCKARVQDAEGSFRGVGVERPNSLCHPCEEVAFDNIRQLPDDCRLLAEAFHEGRAQDSGPKVSGSSDRSIPIPLALDSLLGEIDNEATRWAIRVTKGDPIAHDSPLTAVLANLGTLVDLPPQSVTAWRPHPDGGDDHDRIVLDGVDAVLRLSGLHQRAWALLGLTETTTFLPDPCPHCARKALAVSKDQSMVTCKGCRIVWDSPRFALLSNILDFERKALVA